MVSRLCLFVCLFVVCDISLTRAAGEQVIEAKGLSKGYDSVKLFDNVSFRLERGAIVGTCSTYTHATYIHTHTQHCGDRLLLIRTLLLICCFFLLQEWLVQTAAASRLSSA